MSKQAGQRRVRRWLGSRRGTWDGSKWADFESEDVTVECKEGEQISRTLRGWWRKLSAEASRDSKEPVLLLDFPDGTRVAVVRADTVFVRDHGPRSAE